MKQQVVMSHVLAAVLVGQLAACSSANFSSEKPSKPDPIVENPKPIDPEVNPPAPNKCQDGQTPVGAHLALIIDNSGSNAETDCTGKSYIGKTTTGTFAGTSMYQCSGETDREVAVKRAVEDLKAFADVAGATAVAQSRLAVAAFPSPQAMNSGSTLLANWQDVAPKTQWTGGASLTALRKPLGFTPYGAAVVQAKELMRQVPQDGRARAVILITDGEPTDQDPDAIAAQALELKNSGIKLYTILITSGQERASRLSAHRSTMQSLEDWSLSVNGKDWFGASYGSFNTYFAHLMGDGQNQKSLLEKLSERTVEIDQSTSLNDTLRTLISTQVVKCQ